MKEKYKQQLDSINFRDDFQQETIKLLKKQTNERIIIPMKSKNKFKAILVAAVIFVLFTTTAFAITQLLSPDEVAWHFDKNTIAEAFLSNEATVINKSVVDNNRRITLQGIVSGKELVNINGIDVEEQRSYIVVSVENLDGTPIDIIENEIHFTPLVKGYAPHRLNAGTLGCSASCMVEDGILYCLFDSYNLEVFADHTVYIAAYESNSPLSAFVMNNDGSINYDLSYNGIKALIELPLNKSNADPEAVKEILNNR